MRQFRKVPVRAILTGGLALVAIGAVITGWQVRRAWRVSSEEEGGVQLEGVGQGHGIGLCQRARGVWQQRALVFGKC